MSITSQLTSIGNDISNNYRSPINAWKMAKPGQRTTGGFGAISAGIDLFTSNDGFLGKSVNILEGAASLAVLFSANPYLLFGVAAWFVGKAIFNAVTKGLPALFKGNITEAGLIFGKSALDIAFNCSALKAGKMFGKLKDINTGLFSRSESSIASLLVKNGDDVASAGEKLTRTVTTLESEVSQAEKLLETSTQAYKASQKALRKETFIMLKELKKSNPDQYSKLIGELKLVKGSGERVKQASSQLKNIFSAESNLLKSQITAAEKLAKETAEKLAKETAEKAAEASIKAAKEAAEKAAKELADLNAKLAAIEAKSSKLTSLTKATNKVNPSKINIKTGDKSISLKELIADRKAALAKAQEAVALHAKSGVTDEVISLQNKALEKSFGLNTKDFIYDLTRVGFGDKEAEAAAHMAKGVRSAFSRENIDATVSTVKGTVSRVLPKGQPVSPIVPTPAGHTMNTSGWNTNPGGRILVNS